MKDAQIFLKVWFKEKWDIEPGLLAFPEMKPDLTLAQIYELMGGYKDYALQTGLCPPVNCGFCGQTSCDCPYQV